MAATLGSDLNFFIEDCTAAVCRGRGEQVTAIPVNGVRWFVAARPSTGNSTPQVFSGLQLPTEHRSSLPLTTSLQNDNTIPPTKTLFNRLTTSACRLNPEMSALLRRLQHIANRPALMSGSGSTCFTLCENQSEAETIHQQLPDNQKWVLHSA
ncbi:MAG: hypothetical protein R3C49_00110 [Planctomycetaceae bacterium]